MEIIGLSGYARAGKDSVAKVLVEEYGFTQVGFADKLREVLYALNPVIEGDFIIAQADANGKVMKDTIKHDIQHTHLQKVIDRHGWAHYKETPWGVEIRRLLQRLGTEAGRQTLWDSIWIDAAFAGFDDDAKIVVSDARFINEFDAVTDRGGVVWRINRKGVGPANNHASEMEALDYTNFSEFIYNDGTLEELEEKVRKLYEGN